MNKGRRPCCDKGKVKRGPWSPEEDLKLINHIHQFGHPNWRALPAKAGLLRCGKSCRLRWINYLRPDVKRGNFTVHEEKTIINLHKEYGNRWSKIASHLPGRTDNEIKNVWNTYLKKKLSGTNDTSLRVSCKLKSKKSSMALASSTSSSSSTTSTVSCHNQLCDESVRDSNKSNYDVTCSSNAEPKDSPSPSTSSCVSNVSDIERGSVPRSDEAEKSFANVHDKLFQQAPTDQDMDMDIWYMLEGMGSFFTYDDTRNLGLNTYQDSSLAYALKHLEMELGLETTNSSAETQENQTVYTTQSHSGSLCSTAEEVWKFESTGTSTTMDYLL